MVLYVCGSSGLIYEGMLVLTFFFFFFFFFLIKLSSRLPLFFLIKYAILDIKKINVYVSTRAIIIQCLDLEQGSN